MKVGLIRCMQTEDTCQGGTCLKVMKEKTLAFAGIDEDVELVGVVTCGGCPGKRAIPRAMTMVKNGADTIAFASCITRGNPFGFPCPHAEQMVKAVSAKLGTDIRIINYTH